MILASLALMAQLAVAPRQVTPVLAFPEPGLDDSAAYQGYQTRIFRDAAGNTLQVYLDQRQQRVVHLLADAEDASISFSARTPAGAAVAFSWDGDGATISRSARRRILRYSLVTESPAMALGWFVLGSMRVERDIQYEGRHTRPFAEGPHRIPELLRLADALEQLPGEATARHLALLRAATTQALRARFVPGTSIVRSGARWTVRVTQPSLDGRDTLSLALSGTSAQATPTLSGDSVIIASPSGGAIRLEVEIASSGATLTPLARDEIFTPGFLAFADSVRRSGEGGSDAAALRRSRWTERQVRGVELLVSREKLMAGLPTYATYFGRDMLVSALMMRDIWRPDMSAFAIAAALRKLSPTGEVSHEEALGGQAVREAAAEYVSLVQGYGEARARGRTRAADSLLARAGDVLRHHRRVRENYHMIDDELQLPVLVAQWLGDPAVPDSRKRAFLRERDGGDDTRLARLLLVLGQVARMTAPYAAAPSAATLIAFAPRPDGAWAATSWRDSGAGYGGGRFAMDVNAIWAPHALYATRAILATLPALGFSLDSLARAVPHALGDTPLGRWARDAAAFDGAVSTWLAAGRHFLVQLPPAAVQQGVARRLDAMPEAERAHWRRTLDATGAERDSLTFLALALDAEGAPLGVMNTDVATRLFLGDPLRGAMDASVVRRDVRHFVRPYPAGLFIEGVGPVVANDAFAPPPVWRAFERDPYHGPRVAWGREVNLFLLGAVKQAGMAGRDPGTVAELRDAAARVAAAVEASGFRSELWSYDFALGAPRPVRYGSGADVQLWSTTDLAVQYALARAGW